MGQETKGKNSKRKERTGRERKGKIWKAENG